MNSLAARLRVVMNELELASSVDLAKFCGVSEGLVSQWFSGKTGLGPKPLKALGRTKFSLDWITDGKLPKYRLGGESAAGKGQSEDHRNAHFVRTKGLLPLISWVQAGAWGDIVNDFAPGDAEDWIPCPFHHGPGAFILRVVGLSMYNPGGDKSYAPGEYIAVDPDAEPLNKRMVVARVDHEEKATFKQLILGEDGGMMLRALNPAYTPQIIMMPEGSVIAGVVIGKWTPETF